jgi:DNA-binding response OmpR family regulator
MKEHPCDLVLLDLMLPGKNGYEICKEIRGQYDLPVLMVTARNESLDKVRGFNEGADDYIPKPFDPMELTARVRANLRQYHRLKGEDSANNSAQKEHTVPEIVIGDLRIQPDGWRVFKKDREVRLANREFELLKFLAQNPNIVFSREQLMEKIWGYDYIGDTSTVMVHINRLREKIEDDPKNPRILETVWGAGYRLNNKPE